MHMADALLSPAVGGAMAVVSAAAVGFAVKKVTANKLDEKNIPVMGVLGAFVFAAQMINFTIPGTGSSGHIGGGILLAALLGASPALLVLAVVLLIQCLFFADGGLLAYGCNVFNMGVLSTVFSYLFIFKPIVKKGISKKSITAASIIAVVVGLQAGAFFVVLETFFSGISELPFKAFVILMQPIHLAIGLVEGAVTAAVLCYVYSVRPDLLNNGIVQEAQEVKAKISIRKLVVIFSILTIITGGVLSLFASAYPDGLEWSIESVAGTHELEQDSKAHNAANSIVEATVIMPDYSFKTDEESSAAGTSTAGVTGSVLTALLVVMISFVIHKIKKRSSGLHSGQSAASM